MRWNLKTRAYWLLLLLASCDQFGIPGEEEFVDAISKGNQDKMQAYMKAGGNPNARNKFGDPAIMWAAYTRNHQLVEDLLTAGADPNLAGTGGKSALHWAASGMDLKILERLITGGADINLLDHQGVTPLMQAARKNRHNNLKALLETGADLHLTDKNGKTALMWALDEPDGQTLETLLTAGADPMKKNASGQSVVDMALKKNLAHFFTTSVILQKYPQLASAFAEGSKKLAVSSNEDERPELDVEKIISGLRDAVNENRKKYDMNALMYDPELAAIARAHAMDMVESDYFSISNQRGEDVMERAARKDYRPGPNATAPARMAENIFLIRRYSGSTTRVDDGLNSVEYHWQSEEQLVNSVMAEWMKSGINKSQIQDQTASLQGIGIAFDDQDRMVVVHDLVSLPGQITYVDNLKEAPTIDEEQLTRRIAMLINQKRAEQGLAELLYNSDLGKVALSHSRDMAENNFLDHVNQQGEDPTQRAIAMGYSTEHHTTEYHLKHGVGECLYKGRLYEKTTIHLENNIQTTTYHWLDLETLAQTVVKGLFSEESNRKNLLNDAFEKHGVGIAMSGDHHLYVTQNFSRVETLANLDGFRVINAHERPVVDNKRLSLLIHEEVNKNRIAHNLKPLQYDPSLGEVALGHSRDMAENHFFSHKDRSGGHATQRAQKKGYTTMGKLGAMTRTGIGENIYMDRLYKQMKVRFQDRGGQLYYQWYSLEELARNVVEGWMNSPGHRENLLNALYVSEGLGVAVGEEERVYITQNFF